MMSNSLYIDMLMSLSNESTCLRRHTAAVLVDPSGSILGVGHNGAPEGVTTCVELNRCLREDKPRGTGLDQCIAVHAEVAAVADAMSKGLTLIGSRLVCTDQPCLDCLKLLVAVGVCSIEFLRDYPIVCSAAYEAVSSRVQMDKIDLDERLGLKKIDLALP